MRPHRFTTAAEFVRLSVERRGTPEAFTAKPEAYRRAIAGKWGRALTRSQYQARNARRVHLRAIGLNNAQAVTFAAMLEELSRLRDVRSSSLWAATHYNGKAAELVAVGDIEKAATFTELARRSLANYDATNDEWKALYAEAQKVAAQLPATTSAECRALLDDLEAHSLDNSSRCHRTEYVTPAARSPRTCSTFAHAPPRLFAAELRRSNRAQDS